MTERASLTPRSDQDRNRDWRISGPRRLRAQATCASMPPGGALPGPPTRPTIFGPFHRSDRGFLERRERLMTDGQPTVPTRLRALRVVATLGVLLSVVSLLAVGTTPSFGADPVTFTLARNADMLTFDPAVTEDDPSIFVELQVYDRLVKLNASNNGVDPELATAWTVAPDGLSATFTLRQGVKFSDGAPLTAEDVVFSLTRAIDPKGSWGFLFSPVKSVTKVDGKTVKLNMSEPFAPLLPALSTFAGSIYSKANFEK